MHFYRIKKFRSFSTPLCKCLSSITPLEQPYQPPRCNAIRPKSWREPLGNRKKSSPEALDTPSWPNRHDDICVDGLLRFSLGRWLHLQSKTMEIIYTNCNIKSIINVYVFLSYIATTVHHNSVEVIHRTSW